MSPNRKNKPFLLLSAYIALERHVENGYIQTTRVHARVRSFARIVGQRFAAPVVDLRMVLGLVQRMRV